MDRPNFLVIVSDQHNPHVAGFAGDPVVRTPHLDRLAQSGIAFTNAYCAGPLCVPSRLSFMTGQYPLDLGIWTNAGALPATVPTFAHALNAAGYETVLCGRMHFNGADQHHGFAQRLLGDVSGAMTGMPAGGEMFEGVWSRRGCGQDYGSLLPDAVGPGRATYEVYDEAVVARAVAWLSAWDRAQPERPFCLVVGLLLPHNPYVCSETLFAEYMDRLPTGVDQPAPVGEHPAVQALKRHRGCERISPEQARRGRAAYYGLVTTLDGSVGTVLAALAATGCARNTQVVYTSDHGELCGEHGLWWKDSFYEGAVRVPLLWSGPGLGTTGVAESGVASLCDLSATLADLAAAPELPGTRGRSLAPLLRRDARALANWPGTAFAETCALGERPARMVRRGRWKLCAYHGHDGVQLFDLVADPGETRDLGEDSAFAAVRAELLNEVRHDWDADSIERRVRQEAAEWGWLRQHGAATRVKHGESWPFPAGCNVRA